MSVQVTEPSQTQLSALTSAGQTTDGKLFVVFFGDDNFSLVPASDITSFEQGLKKNFKLHKANKLWRQAVNKAQGVVRAQTTDIKQETA